MALIKVSNIRWTRYASADDLCLLVRLFLELREFKKSALNFRPGAAPTNAMPLPERVTTVISRLS